MSVSPAKVSPAKSRADISSPRKNIVNDAAQEDREENGMSDKAKKNKKGLWNLFNAEYEI